MSPRGKVILPAGVEDKAISNYVNLKWITDKVLVDQRHNIFGGFGNANLI